MTAFESCGARSSVRHRTPELRRRPGCTDVVKDVVVGQLVDHLVDIRGERWAALQDKSRVLVAVDQTIVPRSHVLRGGEEVAFFPPMTGG